MQHLNLELCKGDVIKSTLLNRLAYTLFCRIFLYHPIRELGGHLIISLLKLIAGRRNCRIRVDNANKLFSVWISRAQQKSSSQSDTDHFSFSQLLLTKTNKFIINPKLYQIAYYNWRYVLTSHVISYHTMCSAAIPHEAPITSSWSTEVEHRPAEFQKQPSTKWNQW